MEDIQDRILSSLVAGTTTKVLEIDCFISILCIFTTNERTKTLVSRNVLIYVVGVTVF